MIESTRGVLYPSRLPTFHRISPPPEVAHLVMWFWIPEWDLPVGATSRQEIVAYPALNLVVEPGQVTLSGATTRATHRDLRGQSWAVGALLRPAAISSLIEDPSTIVDGQREVNAPTLLRSVSTAMGGALPTREKPLAIAGESGRSGAVDPPSQALSVAASAQNARIAAARRANSVSAFSSWLAAEVGPATPADIHANTLSEVLMGADYARTPAEAASRLAVSERTLQRIAHRYVGVTPAAMIRRRRLQEAAERVREDHTVNLATLAHELGYSDHAHLTRDFTAVLGMPPTTYRGADTEDTPDKTQTADSTN